MVHHRAVEGQHRGDAIDLEFGQGATRANDGLLAGGAGDDQLGHHRVEGAGHHRATFHAAVQAYAGAARGAEFADLARGGQKALAGILGVDAELEAVAAWRRCFTERQRQAVGNAQLLDDQIDAGGFLGDRVFDLQAGVHLQE